MLPQLEVNSERKTDLSSFFNLNPLAQTYDNLFEQKSSRKTISLFTHLLNFRLNSNWKFPLDQWEIHSILSHIDRMEFNGLEQTDYIDGLAVSRNLQCSEAVSLKNYSAVRRCKSTNFVNTKRHSCCLEANNDVKGVDLISPCLIASINNLVGQFESRYQCRLGNLSDDVSRLVNHFPDVNHEAGLDSEIGELDAFALSEYLLTNFGAHNAGFVPTNMDNPIQDPVNYFKPVQHNSREQEDNLYDQLWELLERSRFQFYSVLNELLSERLSWGRIVAMLAFVRTLCEVVEQKQQHGPINELRHLLDTIKDKPNQIFNIGDNEQFSSTMNISNDTSNSMKFDDDYPFLSLSNQMAKYILALRPCSSDYVLWAVDFIHGSRQVYVWIEANGDWEGLIDFENHCRPEVQNYSFYGSNFVTSLSNFANNSVSNEKVLLFKRVVTSAVMIAFGAVGFMVVYRFLRSNL